MDNTNIVVEESAKVDPVWAEIDAKVIDLKSKYGAVVPLYFIDSETNEPVIGFVKAPNLETKLRIWDLIDNGSSNIQISALIESNLIKECSDPKINNTDVDCERYWMGAILALKNSIIVSFPQTKKK
jgi:hypothetical protein